MTFEAFTDYLLQLFSYSFHCAALPIKAAGCGEFWRVCFYVVEITLFLFVCSVIHRILQNKRDWKKYQQRKIDRAKVADEDVMLKAQWKGDDSFDDVSASQLAENMRQKLNKV